MNAPPDYNLDPPADEPEIDEDAVEPAYEDISYSQLLEALRKVGYGKDLYQEGLHKFLNKGMYTNGTRWRLP